MKYRVTEDIFDDAEHFGWNAIKEQRHMYLHREDTITTQDSMHLIVWMTGCGIKEAEEILSRFNKERHEF